VDTLQPDPRAALGFYSALFEWEFAGPGPMPGDPPGQYFIAGVKGRDVAGIGSRPPTGPPGAMWNTYVRVDSADEAVSAARRAGGSVLQPPFDVPPAGRAAVLADPAGAPFCVWEPRAREGAQIVNEPRAWSMSSLHTSDPEGAKAFYGAVFGWRPEVFGAGGIQMTLWRLPGYVGGEPEQPVPRDVVAVMVPAAAADRGAPPHALERRLLGGHRGRGGGPGGAARRQGGRPAARYARIQESHDLRLAGRDVLDRRADCGLAATMTPGLRRAACA
jgi:hypothetical protein